MEKIKTGIPGLDEILKGGIKRNSSILVSGTPGTGKTILGLQFIYEGAKSKEAGMFISCEYDEGTILDYAKSLGFDFGKYKKLIVVYSQQITGKILNLGHILDTIKKNNIKRVVLDSLTLFQYMEKSNVDFRREVSNFISDLNKLNATLIATSERETGYLDLINYKAEDFLFSGLILLTKIRKGASYERCLTVIKMRGQEHLTGIYPFTINNGVKVFPKEIPFSLIESDERKK